MRAAVHTDTAHVEAALFSAALYNSERGFLSMAAVVDDVAQRRLLRADAALRKQQQKYSTSGCSRSTAEGVFLVGQLIWT